MVGTGNEDVGGEVKFFDYKANLITWKFYKTISNS